MRPNSRSDACMIVLTLYEELRCLLCCARQNSHPLIRTKEPFNVAFTSILIFHLSHHLQCNPSIMSSSSPSDPRDPSTILTTCQNYLHYLVHNQFPSFLSTVSELPSKTAQRWMERDRSWDARQGAIGDPFRGWIDPGLADGIDERRRRYEEYLKRKRRDGGEEEHEGRGGK